MLGFETIKNVKKVFAANKERIKYNVFWSVYSTLINKLRLEMNCLPKMYRGRKKYPLTIGVGRSTKHAPSEPLCKVLLKMVRQASSNYHRLSLSSVGQGCDPRARCAQNVGWVSTYEETRANRHTCTWIKRRALPKLIALTFLTLRRIQIYKFGLDQCSIIVHSISSSPTFFAGDTAGLTIFTCLCTRFLAYLLDDTVSTAAQISAIYARTPGANSFEARLLQNHCMILSIYKYFGS